MESLREKTMITVKHGTRMRLVDACDVLYIESIGRKAVLHLMDETIEYYAKISRLEVQLEMDFFRIHRAYLVNMHYIESYDKREVRLKNKDSVLISKYRFQEFQKKMREFGGVMQR